MYSLVAVMVTPPTPVISTSPVFSSTVAGPVASQVTALLLEPPLVVSLKEANIVFDPAPRAADITYDGKAHELLIPGTTSGGEVQYALNSATSKYDTAIPTKTVPSYSKLSGVSSMVMSVSCLRWMVTGTDRTARSLWFLSPTTL